MQENSKRVVGFTGTRLGMTKTQRDSFRSIVRFVDPHEFHHGDCIGADDQAATFVHEDVHAVIVGHPPEDKRRRAFNIWTTVWMPAKPYLDRNRDIVTVSTLMIACPYEMTEKLRSGTWSTIRSTKARRRMLILIWPDGNRVLWEHGYGSNDGGVYGQAGTIEERARRCLGGLL